MVVPPLINKKQFYDQHLNFTLRTLIDYEISPGTKAKFNILREQLGKRHFHRGIDLGCSGNSLLPFLEYIDQRFYYDIARHPLTQFSSSYHHFPTVGVLEQLPYRDQSFDLISALDVLEHVKDDQAAASEMNRILSPKGILLITVPHRMKYYTYQDVLIGHYRRYEENEIIHLFENCDLRFLRKFGVYGQAMRVQMYQAAKPETMEKKILDLRQKYLGDPTFRKIWSKIVDFGKFWMTIDAKFQPASQLMNIGFLFRKKA